MWVDNYCQLEADGTYQPVDTIFDVMGREFGTYRKALREIGRLIATGQLPPRSPIVAFFLTPTKSVRTVHLRELLADDDDDLEAAS